VTAARVADEVVWPGVHLLKEGSLRIDEPTVPEHPLDLSDHVAWIEHVLEDGLAHQGIDAPGGHGDPMGVGDELGQRAAVDVKRDYPYPGSTPSSSSSLSQLEVRATLARIVREAVAAPVVGAAELSD
jgi:hypothetical protein